MKRFLFNFYIYLVVVFFFGGVYGVLNPPPGKTSLEVLGLVVLACFAAIILYGAFFGGIIGLSWLFSRFSKSRIPEPSRDFFTLEGELDTVFDIDRIARIESNEEDPACPIFETVGQYVDFYRRVVGRRISVRESLTGKSDEQGIEDEMRHLQLVIAPIVDRSPESIMPEERFGEIVPIRDQRKAWTDMLAEFPGLLPWSGTFFGKSLVILLVALFFVIPALGGMINAWFPDMLRDNVFFWLGICGLIALLTILLLQFFYFRHRWAYHASTLREIAQMIVEVKKKYADYPIASVDDVEPLLLKTLSEKFKIPLDSLKPETRLDTELGFEL